MQNSVPMFTVCLFSWIFTHAYFLHLLNFYSNSPHIFTLVFTLLLYTWFYYFFYFRFDLIFEREEGREKEREKYQCVVASHVVSTGDLAHNPGTCPDWESNWQPMVCSLHSIHWVTLARARSDKIMTKWK